MDVRTAPTGIAQPLEVEPPLPVRGRADGAAVVPDVAPLTTLLGLVAPPNVVVEGGEVTMLPPPCVPVTPEGATKVGCPARLSCPATQRCCPSSLGC